MVAYLNGLGRGCLAVAIIQTEATASKSAQETLRHQI
jgi:hypothetical protein